MRGFKLIQVKQVKATYFFKYRQMKSGAKLSNLFVFDQLILLLL